MEIPTTNRYDHFNRDRAMQELDHRKTSYSSTGNAASAATTLRSNADALRLAATHEAAKGEHHTATVLMEIAWKFEDIANGKEQQ
jgi:hypothetical protein